MASIETLAEEALAGSDEAEKVAAQLRFETQQKLEQKIEEALACPCVEDLREGPCGKQFVGAFSCYVRNYKADKLDDCYPKFEAMHICMGDNAATFHKYGSSSEQQDGGTKEAQQ